MSERVQRDSGHVDGQHHEREVLALVVRQPVQVGAQSAVLRRRHQEHGVHQAEQAGAAQVCGRVTALGDGKLVTDLGRDRLVIGSPDRRRARIVGQCPSQWPVEGRTRFIALGRGWRLGGGRLDCS